MDVSSAMVSTGLSLLPSSSPPAGGKSLEFRACLPLLGTQTKDNVTEWTCGKEDSP